MKFNLNLFITITLWALITALNRNIICYYNGSSEDRKDLGQFTLMDLENSLEFCTHLIYGYAAVNSLSLQITSLNIEHDIGRGHYRRVTALKTKYPRIKFLLSLGGGQDTELDVSNKYLQLLEAGEETQRAFIESVVYLLRVNKFDGMDLAFQFPRNVNNNQSVLYSSWKSLRTLFADKSNEAHLKQKDLKNQFSILVAKLKEAFKPNGFMLSLTVLPNINASKYYNGSALVENLDFINLQTFDFITPESSPNEASYTALLYSLPLQGSSNAKHTIEFQVNYWISQRIPRNKINVGIAAYGRAWKLTNDSNTDGYPKVTATKGPAPASYITNLPGILTWAEICPMLLNALNVNKTGCESPLVSVLDPHKDYVTYAFRPPDVNGEHGVWISYDDPRIAAIKAAYVKNSRLGGIALFDVSLDDYRGVCNGDIFPMLRYIKYTFL